MEYKGYYITKYEGPGYTIQFETGGIFFDNVETLEQCYYLIDNYYYSGIDGRLMKRDQAQEESGNLCPWND